MGSPTDALARDFRSQLSIFLDEQAAASRYATHVEVPESSLGHIIGKSHRTIKALRDMPGVSRVRVLECVDDENKQRLQVEGSAEAIAKVAAQINRLHLRSLAGSRKPDIQLACYQLGPTPDAQADDPLILRLATPDKTLFYLPNHLNSFVHRNFPDDFDERMYYYFHSRSSGEAAATNFIAPVVFAEERSSNRRKFLEKSRANELRGSWEQAVYKPLLSSWLLLLTQKCEASGEHMKIGLSLGKMFYYGTHLNAGPMWKLSLRHMDERVLEQRLRPLFSGYCFSKSIRQARQFLQVSGYQRLHSRHIITAQMVDRESCASESFRMKMSDRAEISRLKSMGVEQVHEDSMVQFYKMPHNDAVLSFLNDHKALDFELRLKSCESVSFLDERAQDQIYESWSKRTGEEEPIELPSTGKTYYPITVLHKDSEIFKRDGFQVSLTEVSATFDEVRLHSRWKISIRSLQLDSYCRQPNLSSDYGMVILLPLLESLVTEATKLIEFMAD